MNEDYTSACYCKRGETECHPFCLSYSSTQPYCCGFPLFCVTSKCRKLTINPCMCKCTCDSTVVYDTNTLACAPIFATVGCSDSSKDYIFTPLSCWYRNNKYDSYCFGLPFAFCYISRYVDNCCCLVYFKTKDMTPFANDYSIYSPLFCYRKKFVNHIPYEHLITPCYCFNEIKDLENDILERQTMV